MTAYRYYFRNTSGRAIGWKRIGCDSDLNARKLAMSMLRQSAEIHDLEAWRGADIAFRLGKFDVAQSDN